MSRYFVWSHWETGVGSRKTIARGGLFSCRETNQRRRRGERY
ncbi:MAG TPA: hypothetical protein VM581_02300 [Magnetospirillaceae bacterium]|nr:hypothetical protein [Magnetospirillaceae bacterium]